MGPEEPAWFALGKVVDPQYKELLRFPVVWNRSLSSKFLIETLGLKHFYVSANTGNL